MMTSDWFFQLAKEGGGYLSPFLLVAILWMNQDRKRLLAENKSKDDKLVSLAERSITVATELKTYLFSERKA